MCSAVESARADGAPILPIIQVSGIRKTYGKTVAVGALTLFFAVLTAISSRVFRWE